MTYLDEYADPVAAVTRALRRNFPAYDALVASSGYDSSLHPSELPYVEESWLDANYYDAEHGHLEQEHVYRTSGTTTGKRKKIHYSEQDHEHYIARRRAIFERFLPRALTSACADLGTGHAAASAVALFRSLGLTPFQIDFRAPVAEHVARLNEQRPDVLFTMPMILDEILAHGGLEHCPKKVIVVGDVATAEWKENVVGAFGITRADLMDLYGSIEVGSIAYECTACGHYHFDEHIVPEVIPAARYHDDPALAGTGDIVVLTSLERTYFPAVRFVTGDRVQGFGRLRCGGRERFVYERLLGRVGPELKHGEKLSLYDISAAVHAHLPRSRFEVSKEGGSLVVRVASAAFTREAGDRIAARIRALNPDIDQMIASSLVGRIIIEGVSPEALAPARVKQAIRFRP